MFEFASRHLKTAALPAVLAVLVLLVGMLSSLALRDIVHEREQEALQQSFAASADRAAAVIRREFSTYKTVMRGLQGFFQGSEQVAYREFFHYAESLRLARELPGLRGVGWVELVPRAELPAHLQRQRAELPVPYALHPDLGADVLAPITFIYPLDVANQQALGFDILSNPVARSAALAARDSGEMHISAPLTLIQDAVDLQGQQPAWAFAMYLPVYRGGAAPLSLDERRERLVGWINVPFRLQDFLAGVAAELDQCLRLRLSDGGLHNSVTDTGAFQLIHDSATGDLEPDSSLPLIRRHNLEVGGRLWSLVVTPGPAYQKAVAHSARAPWVLALGLALSLIVSLVVYLVARSRAHSLRRALRLEDLYHALSEVNQAIVRMEHEEQLFPLVCRMAVDFGGMSMAWVGKVDTETGQVLPVASRGESGDYLSSLDVSIREDQASGRGLTGTAVRENRPVLVNDYFADPSTGPWQQRVKEAGWRAAAAFPIQRGGRPHAVLNVYHHQRNAFDEEAIRLFQQMSCDIGFALDNFDREAERRRIQAALSESEARLSAILENVGACIYLKDTEGRYLYANQQVLDVLGVAGDAVIGATDEALFDAATVQRLRETDRRVLELGEVVELEETDTVRATGLTRVFWSVKLPMRHEDGSIHALCGISTDITEHKRNRERIHFLTHYDSLTGLPNKELLREQASHALDQSARTGRSLALLCIDLDRFKNINDSLGLGFGDQVLQSLAERLGERLHLNATLCRSGGDEFFLLLPDTDLAALAALASELLLVIAQPFELQGQRLTLTASIGAACYPQHGNNFDELSQAADAALFEAKQAGRNTFALFTPSMRDQATQALRLETELRDAMTEGQLELHYQPQVDIHSGGLLGLEALLRWKHPESGYVSPARFIPMAEDSGLIAELDAWVMHSALAQQAAWRELGLPIPVVAVNVSAPQFYRADFCDQVEALLAEYRIPPACLDLELTERIAMVHSQATLATLERLRRIGVSLSIDDFGTGYSSLSYLKRYPVRKLKIDKSFVDGVASDAEDQAIVLAIIGLARGLGFLTVAEGVETVEQRDFLRDHGCDAFQGYLHSRPMPADALQPLLMELSQHDG